MSPSFSAFRRLRVVTPRRATFKDLAAYHTRDYLEMVLGGGNGDENGEAENTTSEFGLEDVCARTGYA